MTYRDRPVRCARCSVDLARTETRDCWRCDRCGGVSIGAGELVRALAEIAPDLLPEGGVRDIATMRRRSSEPALRCAVCGGEMDPVFLGGVEIDRCRADGQLWFDGTELERVLEVASAQHDRRRTWLARLLPFLAA